MTGEDQLGENYFRVSSLTFRVIAGASGEDDCPLYQLANFKKGGQLIEAFTKGGSKAVREFLI